MLQCSKEQNTSISALKELIFHWDPLLHSENILAIVKLAGRACLLVFPRFFWLQTVL